MASPITWVAGPVQYWEGNYTHFDMAWDFIGGNADGEIRRWRLRFKAKNRSFAASAKMADRGDQAHATALRNLYGPIAVLRKDLPRGEISVALRAMLSDADVAAATRMSVQKGKSSG